MPKPKPEYEPIVTKEPKSLEDLIALVPNKGDTIIYHGVKVTNSGTYIGLAGKGI